MEIKYCKFHSISDDANYDNCEDCKELNQSPKTGQVDAIVMRTGYLCEVGGTRTFVVADNVAGAMDCLERISNGGDYQMIIHHSIPIVFDA